MTIADKNAYNARCTGKWRIYSATCQWGIVLYAQETNEFLEMYYCAYRNNFWQTVDALCGHR